MREAESAEVGDRLRHVRASKSQKAWARELGVPLRTYQNYERGDREPDHRTLVALHERGWSIIWLLTGVGPLRIEQLTTAQRDFQAGLADGPGAKGSDERLLLQIEGFSAGTGAAGRFLAGRQRTEPPPGDLHEKAFRMAIAAVDAGLDGGRVELPPDVKAEVLIHAYRAVLAALGEDEAAAPTTSEGVAP